MTNALTAEQAADFERLENVIREGLTTFVDVGNALMEIRDRRLYRDVCSSFEAYVQIRFHFSRAHAYRHIEAAKTAGILSPMGDIQPTNERQVRPLSDVPEEKRAQVWTAAVEEAGGKPTEKQVAKAVERVIPESAAVKARRKEKHAARAHEQTPETSVSSEVVDSEDLNGGIESEPRMDEVASESAPVPELGTTEVLITNPVVEDSGASLNSPAVVVRGWAVGFIEALELPDLSDPVVTSGLTPSHRRAFLALSSWAIRVAGKCPTEEPVAA